MLFLPYAAYLEEGEEETTAGGVIPTRIMDHALMFSRPRRLMEMKPVAIWDASYGISVSDGAAVGSWTSRVGGYALTQSNASYKPTYLAHGMGNRACVLFDGGDWLTGAVTPLTSADFTVLTLVQLVDASPGAAQIILSVANSSAADRYIQVGYQDGGYTRFTHRNGGSITGVAGDGTPGTDVHTVVYSVNADHDTWIHEISNVSQTLSVLAGSNSGLGFDQVTGMDILTIGGLKTNGSTAGSPLIGKVAYVALFNRRAA